MFGRSKRLTALVLTLVMLFSAVQPGTFALQVQTAEAGTLTLPASLTEIEDEAFAGIGVLSGLVTLPSGVTRVGARAFKDSGVYALDVPAGVQTVEGQEDELAYLYVRGSSTLLTSASGACFVFAPAGSNAQQTAQAQGVTFVDASTLAVQDGFYYQVADGAATLLCAVEDTAVPAQVTIPETVGGVPVTALSAHAFFGCGQVTQVNVPADVTAAEGAFSGCPNAEVVYASAELQVLSVTADLTEITAGDTVTWTAEATGGTAPYKYQFAVYLGDTRLVQSSYTTENTYAYTFTEAGDYHIIVRVRDDDYTVVEYTGEAFTVAAALSDLAITAITPVPAAPIKDESVTWTVEVTGGTAPYRYAYELFYGSESIAAQTYSDSNTFTSVVDAAGTYTLSVQVLDADNNSVSLTSEALTVTLAPLTADSLTASADAIQTEDTVTWTATASGGRAPYTYAFELTSGETVVAEQPAGESASFAYTFLDAGDYVLTVTVADMNGATASLSTEPFTVALRPVAVASITADKTEALTDDTITWTALAIGGDRVYTYAFSLYKDGEEVDFRAFSQDNTFAYVPAEVGSYHVEVTVRDGEKRTATAASEPVTVTLRPLSIQEVTLSETIIELGGSITIDTVAVGGLVPLKYSYEIYLDGVMLTATAYSLTSAYTYTPAESGEYTFTACVRDGETTTVSKTSAAVTVYDTLTLNSLTAAPDAVQSGEAVTWTADVTGGKGVITYDWYVYYNEELEYTTRTTAPTLTYAPMRAGDYTVRVDAADQGDDTATITGGAVAVSLHASTPAEDFTYTYQNGTYCTITGYTGTDTALVLPGESPDGHIVQVVADSAFKGNTTLTSVVFADSIETMGSSVFQNCTSLLRVTGGASLTNVGSHAFDGCTSLRSYTFAETTATMGGYAFQGCTSLTSFSGWEGLTNIGSYAFYNSQTLTSIDLVDTVTSIGSNAFYQCSNLADVTLPDGLTSIGSYAFYRCTSLESIQLPDSITEMSYYVFYGCSSLTSANYPISWTTAGSWSPFAETSISKMVIPESVTAIPANAFHGMTSLTSVVFPSTLTKIGESAFKACSSLTNIEIPASVTSIDSSAFYDCSSLASVSLAEGLTSIGSYAFSGCTSLESIHLPDSITEMSYCVFYGCSALTRANYPVCWTTSGSWSPFANTAIREMVVPEGVTAIPENAFSGASSFASIELPETLLSIGAAAFKGCSGITSIEIPDGVTRIPGDTFYGCSGLTSVSLPDGLTYIGSYAFRDCTSLQSVHLPDSINETGYAVFYNCGKLTSANYPTCWTTANTSGSPFAGSAIGTMVIPEGVTAIPANAFEGMRSLASVTLPSTLTSMGEHAFRYCDGLTSIEIPEGVTRIPSHAFSQCSGLTSVSLPDGLTFIGSYAFSYCSSLKSVHLPDSITQMQYGVFQNCSGLTSVNYPISWTTASSSGSPFVGAAISEIVVPEGVTAIPAHAFDDMDSLERIILPDTVEIIGENAFESCDSLTEIEIPTKVTSILGYVFYSCGGLTSIVIPEGVTSISNFAFNSCTSLTSITIPATVETIASNAFTNCTNLAIYGVSGSYAETYAAENSIPFNPAPAPEVTLDVSASGSTAGASLVATASAANGSGGYTFCYMLYQDGTLVRQTEYVSATTHTFPIYEAGSYQVVVSAKDRVGMIGTAYGGMIEFSDAECTTISGRVLDDMGNPVQGATVSIVQDTSAATMVLISRSVDLAATVLTDADGQWSWDQAIPGATYTISAAKDGLTFETIISALIDSIWGIVVEPLYALGLGYAPVASGCSLTGTITAADGTPVQGVSVVITTADGTRVANTTTGEDGSWGVMGLSADVAYTVTYGENQTTVEPAAETVTLASGTSASLTAVAELITGVASDRVTFTMSAETIIVGYAATFTVTVPEEATKVRLVVDGSNYDVLYPENGTCTYTRTFTKSGERQVAFQIAVDGVWADISATQTLSIISDGTLDAPVYADITTHYTGTDLTIDWEDVDKAQAYTVWLYYEQVPVNCFETQESAVTIPGNEFPQAGAYGVSVMATGGGYDQSAADDLFTVVLRDYAFEMVTPKDGYPYVVGDQVDMTLTQSGGGYLTVKVTEPSGRTTWYPQTETGLTGEESAWLPFTVTEAGVHTLTPYLYTVSELTDTSTPLYVGKAVEIIVSGPNVRSIKPAGGNYTWVYANESTLVRVTTNNAAESVELYEGDALLASTDVYTEENYIRTFDLTLSSALSKGKHTLTAVAKDADSEASSSKPYSFYVVESVSGGSEVYPQAETLNLYSSPINGSLLATVNGGANIDKLTIIGDAGDWYMLRTADDVKAFAAYEQVSGEAWEGATGSIVITCPPEGVSLPIDPNKYLQFTWNTGLVVPDGATYTITVDALVGDTCITEEADVCEALIAMKRMPADEYTVTVSLVSGGETLATSVPVTFTVGGFTLEDSYRQWWLDEVAPYYTMMCERQPSFSGAATIDERWFAEDIKVEIKAGARYTTSYEADTMAYKQLLRDFEDFSRDSKTNAKNNAAIVQIDPTATRQTVLLCIAKSMLNETEKGNIKLKDDLSNLDGLAQANQIVTQRDAKQLQKNAAVSGALHGTAALVNGINLAKTIGTGQEIPKPVKDCIDIFLDVLTTVNEVAQDAVMDYLETIDTQLILDAYVNEYIKMMQGACDAYVEYLESSSVGMNGSYGEYVQDYIEVFKAIKADPDSMYDLAAKQILEGTGYTPEMVKANGATAEAACLVQFSAEMVMEIFVELVNAQYRIAYEKVVGKSLSATYDLIEWNEEEDNWEFNTEDLMFEQVLPKLTELLVSADFIEQFASAMVDKLEASTALNGAISKMGTVLKNKGANIKNNAGGIVNSALSMWSNACDLGADLRDYFDAGKTLEEGESLKGAYDTWGLQLIFAMNLRNQIKANTLNANYDWTQVDVETNAFLVQDLDKLEMYRAGIVSLTNIEEFMFTCCANMEALRKQFGDEWGIGGVATADDFATELSVLRAIRHAVETRPPVYDELFE